MNIDERIAAAERLIAQRKIIDDQLASLFGGQAPDRKERACGRCGQIGHTSRTCVQTAAPSSQPEAQILRLTAAE